MNICVICFDKCIDNLNECEFCDVYLCEICINKWYNEKQEKICPICKKNINNNLDVEEYYDNCENYYFYIYKTCLICLFFLIMYLLIFYVF